MLSSFMCCNSNWPLKSSPTTDINNGSKSSRDRHSRNILDKNIVYVILTTPAILRATPPKLGRKVPKFVPSFKAQIILVTSLQHLPTIMGL